MATKYMVVAKTLNIRREPRIVEYGKVHNRIGVYTAGREVDVFNIITHSNGETWGRVTLPDNHGISGWMCVRNLHTVFAEVVETDVPVVDVPTGDPWRNALDAWARAKGFDGPRP